MLRGDHRFVFNQREGIFIGYLREVQNELSALRLLQQVVHLAKVFLSDQVRTCVNEFLRPALINRHALLNIHRRLVDVAQLGLTLPLLHSLGFQSLLVGQLIGNLPVRFRWTSLHVVEHFDESGKLLFAYDSGLEESLDQVTRINFGF